jgi:hypothetical protein
MKSRKIHSKILVLACRDRDYILKLKRYILDYYVEKVSIDKEIKVYTNEGQNILR